MARARNAARLGQRSSRSAASASISATCSAGKAPGKLAVARVAKTSSGSGASMCCRPLGGVGARKPIDRRCSLSWTSGGLCSRRVSRWPLKSVAVTNRSSGWPGGSSGGPASVAPPSHRALRRADARSRCRRTAARTSASGSGGESLARTSVRVSRATLAETTLPGRVSTHQTIGIAQNLATRDHGRASGSSSTSTSARSSHKPGQRFERLPRMDRLGQENPVDPARAGPGDDVGQHPQPHPMLLLHVRSASGDRRYRCLRGRSRPRGRPGSRGQASTAPW